MDSKKETVAVSLDFFDLQQIADSGQCFRMLRLGEDCYRVIAGDRTVIVRRAQENIFTFGCGREEYEGFWKHYFDLDTDYGRYGRAVDRQDAYLTAACQAGRGIRILNQDPWEMLITFIISQRKNIPAIRQAVEALCRSCGSCIDSKEGIYAFPTPHQLSALSIEQLRALSLGYRARYIYETAMRAERGGLPLEQWGCLPDDELTRQLLSCYGVGIKVANCVLLFGYHRIGAFPVDVWIDRIQQTYYSGHFPVERYEGYAGVLQQYMFYYERNRKDV